MTAWSKKLLWIAGECIHHIDIFHLLTTKWTPLALDPVVISESVHSLEAQNFPSKF